jgi:hypothetical protein
VVGREAKNYKHEEENQSAIKQKKVLIERMRYHIPLQTSRVGRIAEDITDTTRDNKIRCEMLMHFSFITNFNCRHTSMHFF